MIKFKEIMQIRKCNHANCAHFCQIESVASTHTHTHNVKVFQAELPSLIFIMSHNMTFAYYAISK